MDFDKIKDSLNEKEKNYFFKAIIDCVVFRNERNNFFPIHFIELDSIYHDDERQKEKDTIKDKILSLSGQKLLRIRANNQENLSKEDFFNLIKEEFK